MAKIQVTKDLLAGIAPELLDRAEFHGDSDAANDWYAGIGEKIVDLYNDPRTPQTISDPAPIKEEDRGSILSLSDDEQLKLSRVLKHYFPWLGTDAEDIGGADTINELDELYRALPRDDDPISIPGDLLDV